MSKVKPIVLVNKAYVTLMNQGHEDDEYAYACGRCGSIYSFEDEAEDCHRGLEDDESEVDDLEVDDETDDL